MTTRFCPTLNGYLHLGHLYACLVNRAMGARFILRIDDSQPQWNAMFTAGQLSDFRDCMRADLEWFGVAPDEWSTQSGLMTHTIQAALSEGVYLPDMGVLTAILPYQVVGSPVAYYPGDYRLTAEHVIMDWLEDVNLVIRGMDLITEACAYTIIARLLNIPQVQQVYIPRLTFPGDAVSKTRGNFKLRTYREREYDPQGIIDALAGDCLIDRRGPWEIDNIKVQPVLGEWAKCVN